MISSKRIRLMIALIELLDSNNNFLLTSDNDYIIVKR